MHELVIDRTNWYRGHSGANSALSIKNNGLTSLQGHIGEMCCLGFYCLSLDIPANSIAGITMPSRVQNKYRPLIDKWLIESMEDSESYEWRMLHRTVRQYVLKGNMKLRAEDAFALVNDSERLSDAKKEEYIIATFARRGVQVTFIN